LTAVFQHKRFIFVATICLLCNTDYACPQVPSRERFTLENASGLKLLVVQDPVAPTVRIVLPGHSESDRAIEVLFPEHVTALKSGSSVVEHLYLSSSAGPGGSANWRRSERSFEYERDLPHDIHLLARATLEDDGVRFHYEFTNRSSTEW